MLIKVNKVMDHKLSTISRRSKIKKDVMFQKILEGFIKRYETKNGEIKQSDAPKKKGTAAYAMYMIFKKFFKEINDKEYVVDIKKEKIDLRNMKLLKEKIVQSVMEMDSKEIVAVDENDIVDAFEYMLIKMPVWWRRNMFTTHGIYKNFEKIIMQITHERGSGQSAIDDFLKGFFFYK